MKLGIFQRLNKITSEIADFTGKIGQFFFFVTDISYKAISRPIYCEQLSKQFIEVGFFSLPVVALTSIFTGAVMAIQANSSTFTEIGSPEYAIASIVFMSMTRELGPVIGGLMVAGRASSAMAAEISSMKCTEQIDAMKLLGVDPARYLYTPRLIASFFALPILTCIADLIGFIGGRIVIKFTLNLDPSTYDMAIISLINRKDIMFGIAKSGAFGYIIAVSGCFFGDNGSGGAEGVGKAATNALVVASAMILAINYIMTALLF